MSNKKRPITMIPHDLYFSQVLELIYKGKYAYRTKWQHKDMYVKEKTVQVTDMLLYGNTIKFKIFVLIDRRNNEVQPYNPSIEDLKAKDWRVRQ